MHESIVHGREPGELKHLSTRRKRKKNRFSEQRRAKAEEPKPDLSGVMDCISDFEDSGTVLGKPAEEGESPVREGGAGRAGSGVPRDTRNLVGRRGDHPPRLNTT